MAVADVGPRTKGGASMNDTYTRTESSLPPEGELVDTISEGGIQAQLRRKNNLWFYEDMSMYVYYTPIMWKTIPNNPVPREELR